MNMIMKRLIMATTGLVFNGISIALLKVAGFGTDPFTVFLLGLGNLFHTSYGVAYSVVTAVLLVGIFFVMKKYIGYSTVFNLFFIGMIADAFIKLFQQLPQSSILWVRVVFIIIGLILICIGSALYYSADVGVSAYDAISLILADKKVGPFRVIRLVSDFICVLIGFSLHAVVGVGTIITAFCMGPFIQWIREHFTDDMVRQKAKANI